jgi:hypothetical protein
MDNKPAGTLRDYLIAMVSLLKGEGEGEWARLFTGALEALDLGDELECARIILSGHGGAGSLNDLVLGQEVSDHGTFSWKSGSRQLNDEYRRLLDRLCDFALEIRKMEEDDDGA